MEENVLQLLLEKSKVALRISTPAFDDEIKDIILAGYYDLTTRGVTIDQTDGKLHPLVLRALLTYVRLHFGEPENPDRLLESYQSQLGQLMTTTGFTTWGDE